MDICLKIYGFSFTGGLGGGYGLAGGQGYYGGYGYPYGGYSYGGKLLLFEINNVFFPFT